MNKLKQLTVLSIFVLLSAAFVAEGPTKITWEILRDVTFKKKWDAAQSTFIMLPSFGEKVSSYKGKEVVLSGYMIPVDEEANYYVLSANPFAACFFCGQAGPESVVSVKFKKFTKKFNTDDRVTIKGRLNLNATDINELNYILENAEIAQ